jgi:transaldolase
MPPNTIDAFRDHGTAAVTLTQNVAEAHAQLDQLESVGVSLKEATEMLQDDGVDKFAASFDQLMATLEKKIASYR